MNSAYKRVMSKTPTPPPSPETQAILRHWDADRPHDRIAHLVRDARRGFSRGLQIRLSEAGVAFGHWTFLRVLWKRDGVTQRELSELASVMEPTTFAALKAMEKLGYITRKQRPDNRKNVYVYLTDEGRELEKKLEPLAMEMNTIALRGVSPEHIAITRETLLTFIRNMAEDEADMLSHERRMPSTRETGERLKKLSGNTQTKDSMDIIS
jgi:MarR family transcriptional regulator, organic hydroperoxide resistance regulator